MVWFRSHKVPFILAHNRKCFKFYFLFNLRDEFFQYLRLLSHSLYISIQIVFCLLEICISRGEYLGWIMFVEVIALDSQARWVINNFYRIPILHVFYLILNCYMAICKNASIANPSSALIAHHHIGNIFFAIQEPCHFIACLYVTTLHMKSASDVLFSW